MIPTCFAAEALFASPLQPSDNPPPAVVEQAVTAAILQHGSDGCAALLAQEYGDHPDTAAVRMRWCRELVQQVQPAGA